MREQKVEKRNPVGKGFFFLIFLTLFIVLVPILICLVMQNPSETFPQCLGSCYSVLSLWLVFFIPYAAYIFIRSLNR